jgi:hypothetical protein
MQPGSGARSPWQQVRVGRQDWGRGDPRSFSPTPILGHRKRWDQLCPGAKSQEPGARVAARSQGAPGPPDG